MVLSFLVATLASTPALAKDRPTIAVVGLHDQAMDIEAQRTATTRLTEAIEATKKFEVYGPDRVAQALAGREELVLSEAYVAAGRRLLEDGRTLHDQAQPEEAIPVLEQAVRTLTEAMVATDDSRELWETYLYLGSAYTAENKGKNASEAWSAAVALNPERQPDAARMAPGIVQGYRDVRAARLAKPGKLKVDAPGGAKVFVNGLERGTGTVSLNGLPPGTVHVRVRADGGSTDYAAAEVVSGETTTVALEPADVALPSPGESKFARSRTTTDLYRALGQQAKVDLIVLAGGRDGTGTVQLYAPPADAFTSPLEVTYEGTADDEVIAAIPGVLEVVTEAGTIPALATAATAAALDPSDNRLLASLLLDPQPVTIAEGSGIKAWQLVAGGAGALLIGGGVTAAVIAGNGGERGGTIVVGPVP